MSTVPPYFLEYAAISAFWLFVAGLDLACLWSLRTSRIEATARVLWVIWIVVAPIVGAISYFIAQPTPNAEGLGHGNGSFDATSAQHPCWKESIQR